MISALHTLDATATVARLVALFPPEEQEVARVRLADALQAVFDRRVTDSRLNGLVTDHHILQLGRGEHPPLRTEDNRRGNVRRRLGRLIGRGDLRCPSCRKLTQSSPRPPMVPGRSEAHLRCDSCGTILWGM